MSEEEQFLERTVKIKNLKQGTVLLEFEPNNEQVGSPYYNMQHEQYSFEVNSLAINRRIAQHREKNNRKDVHDYFTIDSEYITAKLKPTGGTRLYSMFGTERIIEDISFVLSKSEELEHCRVWGRHKTDYGGWGPETEDLLQFSVFLNEKRYDSIVSGINQNIEPKISFNVHGVRGFYGESREIDTGLVQYVGTRNPDSVKVLCDEEHLEKIVRDPSRKNKGLEFATLGETNEFDLSLDFSPDTHAKTDEETKRDGTKIHELSEQILILEDKNKNFSAEIKTLQEKLEKIEEQSEQDEESARENIKKTKSLRDAVSDNFPLIFKIALGVIFAELILSLIQFSEFQSSFTLFNIGRFLLGLAFSILLAAMPVGALVLLYSFIRYPTIPEDKSKFKSTEEIWHENRFFLWTLVVLVWIVGFIYIRWDDIQRIYFSF